MSRVIGEQQCGGVAMREKYWDELTEAERVERLRGEVVLLLKAREELYSRLHKFEQHQHGPNGQLLTAFGAGNEIFPRLRSVNLRLEHGGDKQS